MRAGAAAERLAAKMAGTDELGRAFPSNAIKAAEYGRNGALNPPQGQSRDAPSNDVSASTITETNRSDKTGAAPAAGEKSKQRAVREGSG
jgi:catalase